MSNRINYVCEHCGHICLTKKSWKKRIIGFGKVSFELVILLSALIGMLSVYNFGIDNNYAPELKFFSLGGLNSFFLNNFGEEMINNTASLDLRQIALNLSSGCGDNSCKAEKIYEYIKVYDEDYNPNGTFVYEVGSDMDLMRIWNEKKGDCDQLAFLYVSLLHELGINSKVQCNNSHCWAIVNTEGKNIIADLTKFAYGVENE